MLKLFIQTIIRADNSYAGEGMMLALYFIALLILIFYTNDKKIKEAVTVPHILLLAFLYVGIPFISVFIRSFEFLDGRFFWSLLTPAITAVGFTFFVVWIKDKRKQIVALILLIPIIFYSGRFALSNDTYKKATNLYRLPQETLDITEYVLAEKESPLLIVPYTISQPFRQISTKVRLLYGEDATSGRIMGSVTPKILCCREMETTTPNLNFIKRYCMQYEPDYILFDTVYTEFCEDGNINIYNYPADKRYVGDRTPHVGFDGLKRITVVDEDDPHWDLSAYDLSYCGRFGQYVLYRFD